MRSLSARLNRLEQATSANSIFIWMHDGESQDQAKARWLVEHPDQKADLERAGTVNFIRWMIVAAPPRLQVAAAP